MTALSPARKSAYENGLTFAEGQVRHLVTTRPGDFPVHTTKGVWRKPGVLWTDWTGGFLGGMMWIFHRRGEGDQVAWWREQAEATSRRLEHRKDDRNVHDLGFIFMSTYKRWYDLTGEESLHQVLIRAGRTLALRMQKGGYLASFIGPQSLFIDIMMNVRIIFYAGLETGDKALMDVAHRHCRTTIDTIVRPDGGTAHEGVFDVETGRFLREDTHQGFRPYSCWTRGLAWSIYGFTTCFELTGDKLYLETAKRNADHYLKRLPSNGVPPWDFDAPQTPFLADSSAAAIAASGLQDLARASGEDRYRDAALKSLDTLCSGTYLAQGTPGHEGVLLHGVYHKNKGWGVDESVMWGDYFFTEALDKAVSGRTIGGGKGKQGNKGRSR